MAPTIGILGLQGACQPHEAVFFRLGAQTHRVRAVADLARCDALVIPGGESTTMLKMADGPLWEALPAYAEQHPCWGVCAGCILMARHVSHPEQRSLNLMDIDVLRNAYGAQNESFLARIPLRLDVPAEFNCMFIRAPRITRVGEDVAVLGEHAEEPVLVGDERHLASTFHPELSGYTELHAYFLERVRRQCG